MLFDYNSFIQELRENEDKKEVVEKYTRYYGSQDKVDIYETVFYKEYLSKFNVPFKVACPDDLEDDFDWDLLVKLTVASLSSDYTLVLDEKGGDTKDVPKVRLFISAKSDNNQITKDLSELWSFQILRMYEIYIEEEMNLFSLMKEEEDEADSIRQEQRMRLLKFKCQLEPLKKQPDLINELKELL